MMTVITRVSLDERDDEAWDDAMRRRMATAESVDGWVSGQILAPEGHRSDRVIVGVWESRDHWKAWHEDPTFEETRARLEELGVDDGDTIWHESIYSAVR